MARFADLPPELVLHIVSFVTGPRRGIPDLPDLRSINALSQTNTILHQTLDQTLYHLCASVGLLAKLAILCAVRNQLNSSIDRLVAAGISLDMKFPFENNLCTLLYVTAGMGLRDMVAKLLGMFAEGMPARAYTRQGPLQNATPLDIAARNGHMDVVALLATIPSPAVPVPTLGGGSDVLDGAETHRQYLSLALRQSVIAGNTEICKYLISEGADVNFFGKPQFHIAPPLYYASNLATVQLLLASGADPNIHPADHIPLLHAASTSTLEVVQALLDGGADINGPHSHSLLASCRTVGILRCFLECGADPNAAGWGGQIPLHRACEIGDTEFAKASVLLLLQFGAGPVDKLDVRGTSPVDIAMDRYDLDKVVEILEPLVQNSDIKMKITLWRESREPFPVDGSEW